MATTGSTSTSSSKPSSGRTTTRKPASPRSNGARTTRSTTAEAPSKSTTRRTRTTAANKTREAAKANTAAAKTTSERAAKRTSNIAERAALTYVGATLEARDRVVGTMTEVVDRYGSRRSVERELTRFERRGVKARHEIERNATRTRTRVERLVRRNRAEVERNADRRENVVTQQIGAISNRVENVVQVGAATGELLASKVKARS